MSRAASRPAPRIRLAVFDIDGVFTDGSLLMHADGSVSQRFHIRDGHGVKQILAASIQVAIISGRNSPAVSHRMRELGVGHVLQGIADKAAALHSLVETLGIAVADTLFVGDDEPDLPAMALAGTAVAVADAHPLVRAAADWTTQAAGGSGAVREVCDWLLARH